MQSYVSPSQKLTSAWLVHWPASSPLVLMRVVPLYAGQVRDSVVSAHHKYEAEHDTDAKVDPLVCHGGYHFPGILTGVVPLHAVRGGIAAELQTTTKNQKQE